MERRHHNRLASSPESLKGQLLASLKGRLYVASVLWTVCAPQAIADASELIVIEAVNTRSVEELQDYEKTYTKEELYRSLPPNPVVTFEQALGAEFRNFARRLTTNQVNPALWARMQTQQPTEDQVRTNLSALKDKPETRLANIDRIREFLAGQTQRTASQTVKSHLAFLNSVQSGLSLDFDFESVFSTDTDSQNIPSSERRSANSSPLRYGLVLQEITPDPNAQNRAAIGDTQALAYAGQADVRWTIGPITEQENRKIFDIVEYEKQNITGDDARHSTFDDLWESVKLPRPAFKSQIRPENLENMSGVSGGSLPNMRLDVTQVEGYYSFTQLMKSSGQRINGEHRLRVPTGLGDLALGRTYNEGMGVIQTSAYNVLVDRRLPKLNLHRMNREQRYKADLGVVVDGHIVSIGAQGRATGVVAHENERPERYSLNYAKAF